MATVPQTSNPAVSLRQSGWAVNPHTGALSMGLPLGTVPGEIPIPVNFGLQGLFSEQRYRFPDPLSPPGMHPLPLTEDVIRPAFGTIHFGFIRNAWTAPDGSVEPSITLLEDGQEYDGVTPFSTAHAGVTLLLPQAYGFAAPASPVVDNLSQHLFYDTTASGLSPAAVSLLSQHLPTGLGAASTTYKIVMDRSIARVFVSAPVLGGWVPVLWMDRFGHSITFDWNRATTGLPSGATALTSVIAKNSRGRGVEVRWADWSDTTTIHDLVRADFLNMSAPAMLVRGYSGVAIASPPSFIWNFYAPTEGTEVAPPSSTGGPIGRPTAVMMGDPGTVPQPSWNNSGPAPAIQPTTTPAPGPSFSTRAWSLGWDSNSASVTQVVSPTQVTSSFTYASYTPASGSQAGTGALGVAQVDEADGSGATHRVSWTRTPTTTTLPTSVTIQDSWPSAGSVDREWILTYDASGVGAANDMPNKTVLADPSGNPLVTSTPTLTDIGVNGEDAWATLAEVDYASSLGLPNTRTITAFVNGSSNLQIQQVVSYAAPNGSASFIQTQQVQNTFTPRWDMLDAGEVTKSVTTRYDATGATALSPTLTQSNSYDTPASGQAPLLQLLKSYQQIGSWQHGASYGYDSDGRPATQGVYDSPDAGTTVNASPQSVSMGYDGASGAMASAITSYLVPGSPTPGSITQSQGAFDANGRPTQVTDAKGVLATVGYDLLGRVDSVTKAGQTTGITWSGDNRTRTLVQNGQTETDTYDGFGRLLSQVMADGRQISFTYDQDGRKATQKELAGAQTNPSTGQPYAPRFTSWSYDVLDRLVSETDADGVTSNLTYTSSGLNAIKDVTNAATSLKVEETDDAFGQALKRQTFDGPTSVKLATYAYDGMGHLVQVVETDPGGVSQTRSFSYDTDGRLIAKAEPETGTQNFYSFNALGQPMGIAEGVPPPPSSTGGSTPLPMPPFRTRALAYDGLGRLISQAHGSDTLNYTYQGALLTGASTTSNGWTVSQSLGYDALGRLTSESTQQPDFSASIGYGYDSDGRLGSVTYPDGRVVSYGYDGLSRMNAVTQQAAGASPVGVATVGYDPGWGYQALLAFASGAQSVWTTQADGLHLDKWRIQLPNGTALDGDRLYSYDASKDALSQAGEWSLVHDHLGRLVGASASTLGSYSATYGYDAFHNNTSASVSGATPPQAIGFTFGALPLNQTPGTTAGGSATGWAYDAAGEATNFGAAPGSASMTGLVWDGLGRMSQVNAPGLTEQEGYAPSGMRVRRDDSDGTHSRRFVYTSGGLLLAEYIPRSGGGWQWNRDVIYLGSQAIAEVDGNGTHELHSDHLGTPRVITETVSGVATLTGRQNYGPYGESFPAMNSGYQPLTGYTGHVQTDLTGLIYMRGRFYTPIWHRFLNSDQGADPSTWNQMGYVGGSPMMATDPSGMIAKVCGFEPGQKVTDDKGNTYTADEHGCVSAGGGSTSVDINGGHPPDIPYTPNFSWDSLSTTFSPVGLGFDGGWNPFGPSSPPYVPQLHPHNPGPPHHYDDCIKNCRKKALARAMIGSVMSFVPIAGSVYGVADNATGGFGLGEGGFGGVGFSGWASGRAGDVAWVAEKGGVAGWKTLGRAAPIIGAGFVLWQEHIDLDACPSKCQGALQQDRQELQGH